MAEEWRSATHFLTILVFTPPEIYMWKASVTLWKSQYNQKHSISGAIFSLQIVPLTFNFLKLYFLHQFSSCMILKPTRGMEQHAPSKSMFLFIFWFNSYEKMYWQKKKNLKQNDCFFLPLLVKLQTSGLRSQQVQGIILTVKVLELTKYCIYDISKIRMTVIRNIAYMICLIIPIYTQAK